MKKGFFRSTSIIAVATLASRLLGFIRDMLLAHFFGTSAQLDGFFVAFRIPNLFRRLVAEGSLTISFVPVYTEYLECKGEDEALRLAQKVLSLLIALLLIIVVLGTWGAPLLVRLFGFGFTDTQLIHLTVYLNRIMFSYLFFIGIVAFCMGYLNSHRHFFAPAISPVFLNIGFIFGALVIQHFVTPGIVGIAWGVLCGGLMQLVVQIPYMIRHGFVLKFSIDFKHPGVQKIMHMMVPAIIAGAVYQMNQLVNTVYASMLPEGSISFLYYSDRLTEMVMGVFVVSIASVILPEMSSSSASGDVGGLKQSFISSISIALFFGIPAAVALSVSGHHIVSVLFMRGAFDLDSVEKTFRALRIASAGIVFLIFYKMLTQVFFSRQDTMTPLISTVFSLLINASCGFFLMRTPLAHAGLALANVLAMGIQVIFLSFVLRAKIGSLGYTKLLSQVWKYILAALLMGVVLYIVQAHLEWGIGGIARYLSMAALVGAGGITYLFVMFVVGGETMLLFKRAVHSRLGGKK